MREQQIRKHKYNRWSLRLCPRQTIAPYRYLRVNVFLSNCAIFLICLCHIFATWSTEEEIGQQFDMWDKQSSFDVFALYSKTSFPDSVKLVWNIAVTYPVSTLNFHFLSPVKLSWTASYFWKFICAALKGGSEYSPHRHDLLQWKIEKKIPSA